MKKKKKEVELTRIYVPKEFIEIINKIRFNVNNYSWDIVKISNADAVRILIKKMEDAQVMI